MDLPSRIMKLKRHTLLALTVLLLFLIPDGSYAQFRNPGIFKKPSASAKKTRRQLADENAELLRQIDSLKSDIEEYQNDKRLTDSLAADIMDMYEISGTRSAAGLNPEDYNAAVSDSLLTLWYLHNQVKNSREGEGLDMDMIHLTSDTPDKVYLQRLAAMNSFITLPFNETVRNYIILYSEKMPTKMSHILGLCQYYMPIFEEIFSKYDMPLELKYLAIIESALNPVAVSRAGAKGMWQFMYRTAALYGLRIDSFIDERLDPVKSADAAARYLRDSYSIFGDWNLAISSYNCGAGNVNKAIKRAGGKTDFWSIYEYLPRETRGYVPAFVGAMYAITYAKEYGLIPDRVPMPAHVDTFNIHKMLHFKQVNELVGVPMDDLHNLNPQYIADIIPSGSEGNILRIPYQYTGAFVEHEDSVYTYKEKEFFSPATITNIRENNSGGGGGGRIVYRVKKGDYLGRIASRYHVSINQIKRWNNLRGNNLSVGQRLYIYSGGSGPSSSSQARTQTARQAASGNSQESSSQSTAGQAAPAQRTYTVKSGDTLTSIAAKYPGVSVADIQRANGISGSRIRVGQKLKIPSK